MIIEINKDNKRIPLKRSETLTILLLFILAFMLAWYAGGLIGTGLEHAVKSIVDHAEKRQESSEYQEKNIVGMDMRKEPMSNHVVPVEIPDVEEHERL